MTLYNSFFIGGTCDETGFCPTHEPLARDLALQSALIEEVRQTMLFKNSNACLAGAADENTNSR